MKVDAAAEPVDAAGTTRRAVGGKKDNVDIVDTQPGIPNIYPRLVDPVIAIIGNQTNPSIS